MLNQQGKRDASSPLPIQLQLNKLKGTKAGVRHKEPEHLVEGIWPHKSIYIYIYSTQKYLVLTQKPQLGAKPNHSDLATTCHVGD